MVQPVKVPAAKSEDLSSIPGTHIMEGENRILYKLSFYLHKHTSMSAYTETHRCTHTHTHTHTHTNTHTQSKIIVL